MSWDTLRGLKWTCPFSKRDNYPLYLYTFLFENFSGYVDKIKETTLI